MSMLRSLRVLVVHDWLVTWAGAERCLEQIIELVPQADLVVGLVAPHMRDFNDVTRRARETWLARLPGARAHHRWFLPMEGLAFATLDATPYDLIISSSHAFAKAVRKRRQAVHVCYCYTPPRYIWDLREAHWSAATLPQRVALAAGTRLLRRLDRWYARGVDQFIGISRFVAERISRCYGQQAEVVYPPVQRKGDSSHGDRPREDFVLYLGRLVSYKRVELAIEACMTLGVRLVIAGDGPERKRLERLADSNVQFLGEVSEQEAARLLSTCSLFVFCAEEEFGIAPVEANAYGTPVIGYARGGLVETMVEGVTAEFFHELTLGAITEAVLRALRRNWDRTAIMANAERFTPERFREGLARSLTHAMSSVRGVAFSRAAAYLDK